jgi:hypothetical protein
MDEKITSQDSNNPNPTNLSPAISEVSAPKSNGRPSLLWTLVSQLLVLGWLAPIIALLTLNFRRYIAGASVGCGVGSCNDNPSSQNATQRSQQLDTEDHNILGALQLVAKILEIWFIFLAGCLVYDLTMLLAKRGDGLPIRYLTTPIEFGELRSFFDRSLWTSASPSTNKGQTQGMVARIRKLTLYSFILFVAVICIISNLMGPATAVLLLPTLVWRDVQMPQTQVFAEMASPEPPSNINTFDWCDASALAAGYYSCTNRTVQNELDSIFQYLQEDSPLADLSDENGLTFSFNLSNNPGSPVVVPNRQTLDDVVNDYGVWTYSGVYSYAEVSSIYGPGVVNLSTYNTLRNAQQVKLRRQGPGLLFQAQCYPNVSVIQISDDKVVRCYDMPNPDSNITNENNYQSYPYPISTTVDGTNTSTMCIRVGSGWVGGNTHSKFSIRSSSNDSIAVDVYSTDRAIYLTSTTYHCSAEKIITGAPPCNWDALFSADPASDIKNATANPLMTEYSLLGYPTIWCRSFAFLRFPTYVLDTSPATNPLNLVLTEDNGPVTPTDEPISIHPDWTLAAWSVDKGQMVPGDRPSAQFLVDGFLFPTIGSAVLSNILIAHSVVAAQSFSLIDYSTKDIDAAGSAPTPTSPILEVGILIFVWSYGLESRTSKLGAVIVILGCVIVLMRMVVGICVRTVDRDLLKYVTTALEQSPPGVFTKLEEEEVGKVRFRMENQEGARFVFKDVGN